MVGADAADDAVARARQLDGLGVGLHLVVVCGKPVLPASEIPDLVAGNGEFDTNLVRSGFRYFFLPKVRRQLAREIRAQFEAFERSGLELDHVNAHNHMHLHPTILSHIIRIGSEFGVSAVRVPHEPVDLPGGRRATVGERIGTACLRVWIGLMRFRLRRAGLKTNDRLYGIRDSGAMTGDRILDMLQSLPNGVTEIFSHPARGAWDGVEAAAAHYRFEDEFQALIDTNVKAAAAAAGASLVSFKDI